jgi:hypothetical protein
MPRRAKEKARTVRDAHAPRSPVLPNRMARRVDADDDRLAGLEWNARIWKRLVISNSGVPL